MVKKILILFCVLFIGTSCHKTEKRIAYINSYHEGYPPSDEIKNAVAKKLSLPGIDLKILYLDSKRQTAPNVISNKIDSVHTALKKYNPDLIIASDDFAVKHIVNPFYNSENSIPVVFCGVNWSADQYKLNSSNITGMLEVLPLRESLVFFKNIFPKLHNLAVLSENSLSEINNTSLLDTLYTNLDFKTTYLLADNFADWKEMFIRASGEADIIYMPTNGSIKDWDEVEAIAFVKDHIKIPLFTCDDFMMPFCVAGFTKVASEQGEWAAETALKILKGTKPSEIPLSQNNRRKIWLNPDLAEKIGFRPDDDWLNEAIIYTPE